MKKFIIILICLGIVCGLGLTSVAVAATTSTQQGNAQVMSTAAYDGNVVKHDLGSCPAACPAMRMAQAQPTMKAMEITVTVAHTNNHCYCPAGGIIDAKIVQAQPTMRMAQVAMTHTGPGTIIKTRMLKHACVRH